MIKKIIFIQICAAMFVVPLVSLAASVTAVSGTAVGSLPCYPFSHSLSVGSTGSDVTALQNFLAAQGDFNVSPTGYFGVITRAAVGRVADGEWRRGIGRRRKRYLRSVVPCIFCAVVRKWWW